MSLFLFQRLFPKHRTFCLTNENIKEARESATLLIPRIRPSHCLWNRINNAEAHAVHLYVCRRGTPRLYSDAIHGRCTLRYCGSNQKLRSSIRRRQTLLHVSFNMSCRSRPQVPSLSMGLRLCGKRRCKNTHFCWIGQLKLNGRAKNQVPEWAVRHRTDGGRMQAAADKCGLR